MRFKYIPRDKWHRWFAWFPVSLSRFETVWLEFIERKQIYNEADDYFEYREIR